MTPARDLADRFHERWLHANPFAATMYGIPGYDDLLPDGSAEGQQAWRAEAGQFLQEAAATARGQLTPADAVTLDCMTEAAAQELAITDLAQEEHTVTAISATLYAGPAAFLAVAARTVLVDPVAAEAYLTRLRRSGAVRRAEERAGEFFPDPLPPPCEVTPMPEVVAAGTAAPHYTPPRLDGGRPGTFWFNTRRPTAGTGWDIDVVAFHEAVPGHHLQLSRLQLLTGLPALQRQRSLPVFSEGWGCTPTTARSAGPWPAAPPSVRAGQENFSWASAGRQPPGRRR
jgi:uncharacterized protein (DUF885 family)